MIATITGRVTVGTAVFDVSVDINLPDTKEEDHGDRSPTPAR